MGTRAPDPATTDTQPTASNQPVGRKDLDALAARVGMLTVWGGDGRRQSRKNQTEEVGRFMLAASAHQDSMKKHAVRPRNDKDREFKLAYLYDQCRHFMLPDGTLIVTNTAAVVRKLEEYSEARMVVVTVIEDEEHVVRELERVKAKLAAPPGPPEADVRQLGASVQPTTIRKAFVEATEEKNPCTNARAIVDLFEVGTVVGLPAFKWTSEETQRVDWADTSVKTKVAKIYVGATVPNAAAPDAKDQVLIKAADKASPRTSDTNGKHEPWWECACRLAKARKSRQN